jgi:hypothetical protein
VRRSSAWLAVVAGLAVLAYITLNTVRTEGPGSRGVPAGERMPPFAVLLARADRQCDGRPCDAALNCDVRGRDVLNVCDLERRGPVALAFVAEGEDECREQIDVLERLKPRYPGVQFAAIAIRGDRDDLLRTIRERHWTLPVGYDHDGAIANTYAVAVCPTITFAERGGVVRETSIGLLGEDEIARRLERLG